MKMFTRFLFVLVVLLSLATSDRASRDQARRIRFQIATVEERAGARDVISEALVEGPPGTDFTINLQGGQFKMNAKFMTDLVSPDRLKVRARLNTRRLYGVSERDLPLYEEDSQNEALDLGFDEAIVLLPYGRNGGDKLKIEITPAISDQPVFLASGEQAPLAIKIFKQSPGGAISINASKIPHNFEVEALLTEDDREVARGSANFLIEEAQELMLAPTSRASSQVAANPLAIKLLIGEYARTRPSDLVGISFDLSVVDGQSGARRETVASGWAGNATLGNELVYDISDHYLKSSGKQYRLRIRIKPARGEILE